jgi:hypothetical protein
VVVYATGQLLCALFRSVDSHLLVNTLLVATWQQISAMCLGLKQILQIVFLSVLALLAEHELNMVEINFV